MEAVYIDIDVPLGLSAFATVVPARGGMFSARRRLNMSGEAKLASPLSESDLYASVEAEKQD